jgi:GNAT superfamily N-acetyltransferase
LIAAAIAELNVRYPGDVELEPVPEVSEHFVAVADGVAVGLVVLVRVKAGQGEVKRLYVHPGHRGRGAARALMSALEERARGRGMSAVRLETGTRQPEPAHPVLRKTIACRCHDFSVERIGHALGS